MLDRASCHSVQINSFMNQNLNKLSYNYLNKLLYFHLAQFVLVRCFKHILCSFYRKHIVTCLRLAQHLFVDFLLFHFFVVIILILQQQWCVDFENIGDFTDFFPHNIKMLVKGCLLLVYSLWLVVVKTCTVVLIMQLILSQHRAVHGKQVYFTLCLESTEKYIKTTVVDSLQSSAFRKKDALAYCLIHQKQNSKE